MCVTIICNDVVSYCCKHERCVGCWAAGYPHVLPCNQQTPMLLMLPTTLLQPVPAGPTATTPQAASHTTHDPCLSHTLHIMLSSFTYVLCPNLQLGSYTSRSWQPWQHQNPVPLPVSCPCTCKLHLPTLAVMCYLHRIPVKLEWLTLQDAQHTGHAGCSCYVRAYRACSRHLRFKLPRHCSCTLSPRKCELFETSSIPVLLLLLLVETLDVPGSCPCPCLTNEYVQHLWVHSSWLLYAE